jgi:hypothetical protein
VIPQKLLLKKVKTMKKDTKIPIMKWVYSLQHLMKKTMRKPI